MTSLATQIAELLWLARAIAGLLVVGLVVGVPFAVRLSRRLRKLEAWQAEATQPLRKLAAHQQAEEARQRVDRARRPHVFGDPDAPM